MPTRRDFLAVLGVSAGGLLLPGIVSGHGLRRRTREKGNSCCHTYSGPSQACLIYNYGVVNGYYYYGADCGCGTTNHHPCYLYLDVNINTNGCTNCGTCPGCMVQTGGMGPSNPNMISPNSVRTWPGINPDTLNNAAQDGLGRLLTNSDTFPFNNATFYNVSSNGSYYKLWKVPGPQGTFLTAGQEWTPDGANTVQATYDQLDPSSNTSCHRWVKPAGDDFYYSVLTQAKGP
jgi:hypothetical protein